MLQGGPAWQSVGRGELGFLNTLSEVLEAAERQDPRAFPMLRRAKRLFVASDYGGEHAGAGYQTISFLIADLAECAVWQSARQSIRARYLPDRRRMAFKNLNDRIRRRALDPFLESANQIPGLLATFAIASSVKTLFVGDETLGPAVRDDEILRTLAPHVAEKFLRVIHLLSFLVAGFSAPSQDLLWATDEDAIAANPSRVWDLVNMFARVSSHCLPHGLGHLRVATSKQDSGDLSLEDFLAVPDMAAGGLSAALEEMFGGNKIVPKGFWLPPATSLAPKAKQVLDWFSDNTQPLRRFVLMIDEEAVTGRLRGSRLVFHGSRDLRGRP